MAVHAQINVRFDAQSQLFCVLFSVAFNVWVYSVIGVKPLDPVLLVYNAGCLGKLQGCLNQNGAYVNRPITARQLVYHRANSSLPNSVYRGL